MQITNTHSQTRTQRPTSNNGFLDSEDLKSLYIYPESKFTIFELKTILSLPYMWVRKSKKEAKKACRNVFRKMQTLLSKEIESHY